MSVAGAGQEVVSVAFNFTIYAIRVAYQRISSDKASNLPKRDVRFILLK